MRTQHGHLTYCSNIHPGESWEDHFKQLQEHIPVIKKQVSPDKAFGIGLRLSNKASIELIKEKNLEIFRQWLLDNDCYVFTMNGFPYGGFHRSVVKDKVHAPDWTTAERLYHQAGSNIIGAIARWYGRRNFYLSFKLPVLAYE